MTSSHWEASGPGAAPGGRLPQNLGTPRKRSRRRAPILAAAAAILLAVGVGGFLLWQNLRGSDQPQTPEGFAELLADLQEETGGTTVTKAVIYPGYAIVDVPVAPEDTRYVSYRWDGSLHEWTKGSGDERSFDLADLDSGSFAGMCAEVSDLVTDAVSESGDCYLYIRRPTTGQQFWISAYASNEFGQSGYIQYDLEGNEVSRNAP